MTFDAYWDIGTEQAASHQARINALPPIKKDGTPAQLIASLNAAYYYKTKQPASDAAKREQLRIQAAHEAANEILAAIPWRLESALADGQAYSARVTYDTDRKIHCAWQESKELLKSLVEGPYRKAAPQFTLREAKNISGGIYLEVTGFILMSE